MADNLLQDSLAWMRSPQRTQAMQGIGGLFTSAIDKLKQSSDTDYANAQQFVRDPLNASSELMQQITGQGASLSGFAPVGMIGTRFKGSGSVPTEVPGFGPAKEIQDTGSSINVDNLVKALANDKNAPKNLGDILNHPELYRDYPELAKYPVQGLGTMQALLDAIKGSGLKGMYADGGFYLPSMSQKGVEAKLGDIHSTLLHETQHAIQALDKMPEGGMTEQFLTQGYAKARQKVDTLKKAAYKELESKIADKGLDSNTIFDIMFDNANGKALIQNDKTIGPSASFYQKILKADYKLQKKYDDAYNKYRSLGGEAQARAVQKRFENPAEYAKPVTQSYDVPIESLNYRDPMGFTIK
jgi:hypothetical protein